IPLNPGSSVPGEFSIEDLKGSATVRIHYDRAANTVDVYADYVDGALPYRPTYVKDYDDSTEFNPQLIRVDEARWQLWLVGTMAGPDEEDAYYSIETQRFLGTRFDFEPIGPRPFPEPGTFFTLGMPVTRMICSPIFEGTPDGEGHFHFRFDFDQMRDAAGTPGVINMAVPFDLCHPDQVTNYWTQTRLPDDQFMSFDTFLNTINIGRSIIIAQSAEPYPKPASLAYRDNTFLAWGNLYPQLIPRGYRMDIGAGGILRRQSGVDHHNPPYAPSTIDLCPEVTP
ncbi:MAG: hypothetical protein H5U40_14310, partial [Polyangiaceae bacterium]|nr:hypothetical protein [Polyangiaceae bacterium]